MMTNETHEDILIGRVAANEADQQDWSRFVALALTDTGAWERLARTLRDELQLRAAAAEALEEAESIELPAQPLHSAPLARLRSWPGWALAAMIAVAWVGATFFNPPMRGGLDSNTAQLGPVLRPAANSADDAYADYLRLGASEGRVLQELPMVMVETRQIEGEAVEVVYVRQLLERALVDSAYRLDRDELGRPTPQPIDLTRLARPHSDS